MIYIYIQIAGKTMEVYNYNGVQETTITVYIGIQKAK